MNTLHDLYRVLQARRAHPHPGSYTAQLLAAGEDRILQKIGEEAVEVLLAAKGQGRQRLIEEVADLTYHVLVLLVAHDIPLDAIAAELARRHRPRGRDEDARASSTRPGP